jgi:hypothetical protein
MSGSKGIQQSEHYVIEDPRSVFYVHDDKQVIVYFEWEGPPGTHHLEGFWKNPDGKVVTISDFQYNAQQRRFGAYWTLALADSAPTGTWVFEAHVDGESAGSHTFQIVAGKRPEDATPVRRMLTPSEAYQRALSSVVSVERIDKRGDSLGVSSGFVAEAGVVLTAFESIDSASRVRVLLPDGKRLETDQILAWNRRQDWAALKVETGKTPPLPRATTNSWNVGDACTFLEMAPEGNRVINEVTIDGKNSFPGAGERLNLSTAPTEKAIGGPLMNEYGDVVAIVGGSLIPGASALNALAIQIPVARPGAMVVVRGGMAVPISSVTFPTSANTATSLDTLAKNGELLPPVTAGRNVGYGQLARGLDKKGGIPWPMEGGEQFSHRDAKMTVYLTWDPKEKGKGMATVRIHDLDNHLLNPVEQTKPLRVNFYPGEHPISSWQVGISTLPPGIYRVDVFLDEEPAWRSFFRITE